MTGNDEKSWTWLHSVLVPALLAAVEATWVSLWTGAFAHASPHTRVDVPYLAVALPTVLAVVVSARSARFRWPVWCRPLILVPVVLVAIAASAGVIGALYLHGSFSALATHPWTVAAKAPSVDAALAWLIATLTWSRGTWLGWQELTAKHAAYSVAVSTLAYIVLFVVAATHHADSALRAAMGPAAVLLLLSFPCAIAVIALVHERELERTALTDRISSPNLASLGVVVVPMIGVAALATLIALGIRPLSPLVGRLVMAVARWVASMIDDVIRWIAHFFHAVKVKPTYGTRSSVPLPHQTGVAAPLPHWVSLVATTIGALVTAVVVLLILRMLLHLGSRTRRSAGTVAAGQAGERSSVFSWGHLRDQLLASIRRLLAHMRGAGARNRPPVEPVGRRSYDASSVRHHYRRVLLTARIVGHAREVSETPEEFEQRLSSLEDVTGHGLREMTVTYERVRYGEVLADADQIERFSREADSLIDALLETVDVPTQSVPGLDYGRKAKLTLFNAGSDCT